MQPFGPEELSCQHRTPMRTHTPECVRRCRGAERLRILATRALQSVGEGWDLCLSSLGDLMYFQAIRRLPGSPARGETTPPHVNQMNFGLLLPARGCGTLASRAGACRRAKRGGCQPPVLQQKNTHRNHRLHIARGKTQPGPCRKQIPGRRHVSGSARLPLHVQSHPYPSGCPFHHLPPPVLGAEPIRS